MQKTGSSSIQETFFRYPNDSITYAKWSRGNLSDLAILLFKDLDNIEGFIERNKKYVPNKQSFLEKRKTWLEETERSLYNCQSNTYLFSAEALSGLDFEKKSLYRMKDLLCKYSNDIFVFSYAREPISFMNSYFQELVKQGLSEFDPMGLWPHYRRRFQKLDEVFSDAHQIKKFDRDSFVENDVVLDFAKEVGLNIQRDQVIHVNESLSLEATSILFARNRLGPSFLDGIFKNVEKNGKLRSIYNRMRPKDMIGFGNRKLVLERAKLDRVVDANRKDLDWIESRLSAAMANTAISVETAISSTDDLMQTAFDNREQLVKLLEAKYEEIRSRRFERYLKSGLRTFRRIATKGTSKNSGFYH